MNLNTQLKVPGYRFDKFLGKGGMATVYLATQMSLGRAVALKVLNDPETPQFFERFFNEGRCVARLQHNNLVTIYDIGQGDGFYYIAMEHLPGGDLKSRIAQGIKPNQALKILTRLASCLGYVHSQGLVHRDIKPSNVLFRADGTPVLTDFGIAKLIQADNDLTLSGTVMGSPHYLSPEQAQGNPKLDGRSDLYSLGVVLYEMLAGRKPYNADNFAATLMAHIRNPVPLLPAQLVQFQPLIDRLLAKKPEDRFQSGTELANNIRLFRGAKIVSLAPQEAEPDSNEIPSITSRETRAPENQNKSGTKTKRNLGIGVGLVGCLLLSSLLFGWTGSSRQLESKPVEVAQESPSRQSSPPPRSAPRPAPAPTPLRAASPPLESTATLSELPAVDSSQESTLEPKQEPMAVFLAKAEPPEPVTASMTPATPEQDDPAAETEDELSVWLIKAERELQRDRLSLPRGESARDYLRKVLTRDPGNRAALSTLDRVADRYLELARKQVDKGRYRKAQRLIDLGLATRPGRADLKRLQRIVQRKQRAKRSAAKKRTAVQVPQRAKNVESPRKRTNELPMFTQEHGS